MNADTGIAYQLGRDLIGEKEIGEKLDAAFFHAQIEELSRPLSPDEMAAAVVDAAAAQRARLGDRELRRRRQRRR